MAAMPLNPFHFGKAVEGEDFCPRPNLEQLLSGKIQAGQNTVWIGRRRVGKTSLIRRVAQADKHHAEIYVDLFGIRSVSDVVERLVRTIAAVKTGPKWMHLMSSVFGWLKLSFEAGGVSVEITHRDSVGAKDLQDVFKFLDRENDGRWIVILDEFQEMLKVPDARPLLGQMRSQIQFLRHTPFVFSGSDRTNLYSLFYDSESPLFKSAELIEVNPIERDRFAAWITKRFASGHRRIARELLEQIFNTTDDVPGDVQQFCAALWEATRADSVIHQADLQSALSRIWAQEQRLNEQIVSGSTGIQLRCLVTLAKNPATTPTSKKFLELADVPLGASVLKALKSYEKLGVLWRSESKYRFTNPFFKAWLTSTF